MFLTYNYGVNVENNKTMVSIDVVKVYSNKGIIHYQVYEQRTYVYEADLTHKTSHVSEHLKTFRFKWQAIFYAKRVAKKMEYKTEVVFTISDIDKYKS